MRGVLQHGQYLIYEGGKMIETIASGAMLAMIEAGIAWGVVYAVYKTIKMRIQHTRYSNGSIKAWATRRARVHTIKQRTHAINVRYVPYTVNGYYVSNIKLEGGNI